MKEIARFSNAGCQIVTWSFNKKIKKYFELFFCQIVKYYKYAPR